MPAGPLQMPLPPLAVCAQALDANRELRRIKRFDGDTEKIVISYAGAKPVAHAPNSEDPVAAALAAWTGDVVGMFRFCRLVSLAATFVEPVHAGASAAIRADAAEATRRLDEAMFDVFYGETGWAEGAQTMGAGLRILPGAAADPVGGYCNESTAGPLPGGSWTDFSFKADRPLRRWLRTAAPWLAGVAELRLSLNVERPSGHRLAAFLKRRAALAPADEPR